MIHHWLWLSLALQSLIIINCTVILSLNNHTTMDIPYKITELTALQCICLISGDDAPSLMTRQSRCVFWCWLTDCAGCSTAVFTVQQPDQPAGAQHCSEGSSWLTAAPSLITHFLSQLRKQSYKPFWYGWFNFISPIVIIAHYYVMVLPSLYNCLCLLT